MSKGELKGGKLFYKKWLEAIRNFQVRQMHGEELSNIQALVLHEGGSALHHLSSLKGDMNGLEAAGIESSEKFSRADLLYTELSVRFGHSVLEGMDEPTQRSFKTLRKEMDDYSQGWTSAARDVFKAAGEAEGSRNLVLTASKLLSALAKLILFSLNKHVSPYDVVSVWMEGKKKNYMSEVKARYPHAEILVIGDGREEREAARELKLPFYEITKGSCGRATMDLRKLKETLSKPAKVTNRRGKGQLRSPSPAASHPAKRALTPPKRLAAHPASGGRAAWLG